MFLTANTELEDRKEPFVEFEKKCMRLELQAAPLNHIEPFYPVYLFKIRFHLLYLITHYMLCLM